MSPTATLVPATDRRMPPDLEMVIGGSPVHPALVAARRPTAAEPTAATLNDAALAFATFAAMDLRSSTLRTPPRIPLGAKGFIHQVGEGGVLHLTPATVPRAVSVARGTLTQRCTTRPSLRPGVVRLLPAGRELILANLDGRGALAVEVLF